MVDLEQLVLRCRTESSRAYLREAVDAYHAGAYRACIVTTWLAVNFDLTAKLRSLAIAGTPIASSWVANLDTHLAAYDPERPGTAGPLLTIERSILNTAAKVGIDIISPMELSDLKRLRTDRNRCAHPTMLNGEDVFSPSAELARGHLRNAVDLVLGRHAITGQRLVDRIMQVIESPGLAATSKELADYLESEQLLAGLSPMTMQRLLDTLVDQMLAETAATADRSKRLRALEAIRRIRPADIEMAMPVVINEKCQPAFAHSPHVVMALIANAPWIWGMLNRMEQGRLSHAIKTFDVVDGDYHILQQAAKADPLRQLVIDRLKDVPVSRLDSFTSSLSVSVVLDESCRRLAETETYDASKRILRTLLRPNLEHLEARHVTAILAAFRDNDQASAATGMPEFLIQILEQTEDRIVGGVDQWQEVRPKPGPWDVEGELPPLAAAIDARFATEGIPGDVE